MTKWVGVAALALVLLGMDGRSAYATDGCFWKLRDCYYDAAKEDYWGDRWLRGLDCELEFADCVRRQLIGR